jgi:hypothetical protein
MLTVLALTKLAYCTEDKVFGCPGVYENALDEGARGQSYIANIDTPSYTWNTTSQPDDYGAAYGVTPNTLGEYGYDTMPVAFVNMN